MTDTLAAQIEALAAIVANIPVSAMVGRCGWKTHADALNGLTSALSTLPAIVTALRQAEAAPGVVEALQQCRDQFAFYTREHLAAGKNEKSETNQRFVTLCDDALHRPELIALARQHGAREPGRPIGTEPPACSVLGGRFNESWGGWTFAVVNTPMAQPFTHWWPLPGFDDAEIVLLPAAPATDVEEG